MGRFREFLRRALFLTRRRRFDAEMDEELGFHLDMLSQRLAAGGVPGAEARHAAVRRLGNLTRLRERSRDAWGWAWLDTCLEDGRLAVRMLGRAPALTVTAVVVLAIGVGANTTIFSLVNAVLFRPLPVERPHELRFVYQRWDKEGTAPSFGGMSYDRFLQLAAADHQFAEIAGKSGERSRLRVGSVVEQARGEAVTWNYFDVLGVTPVLGRTFAEDDDNPDRPAATAVISYGLWRRRFNADPAVIGTTIELEQARSGSARFYGAWRSYTVVGVMPPAFGGTLNPWEQSDYWVGLEERASAVPPRDRMWRDWRESALSIAIGRLKPGVSGDAARRVVEAFGQPLLRESNDRAARSGARERYSLAVLDRPAVSLPFGRSIVPARLAGALLAIAAVVLLIATANLAGVLLARGVRRSGEIAIRLALGAGQWRLARQLLTESLALAVLGGAFGLVFARAMLDVFLAALPASYGYWQRITLDVPIDLRVLLFTAAVCVAAGLLVGLAPALQALRTDLLARLGPSAAVASRPVRARLRYWVVAPQVCLSVALLVPAGATVRSLVRTEFIQPGYDPEHVVLVSVELPQPPHDLTAEAAQALQERLRETNDRVLGAVRGLPDVAAAGMAMLFGTDRILGGWSTSFVARDEFPEGIEHAALMLDVSSGYLETLAIPLVRGRHFDSRDTPESPKVAIVDAALARILWPGADPLGRYVAQFSHARPAQAPEWLEVVGIAGEVRHPLSDGRSSPTIYVLDAQSGWPMSDTLVVRGRGNPSRVIDAVQRAVTDADVQALSSRSRVLTDELDAVRFPRRLAAAILAASAFVGLLLSTIGLYGVVAYSVAERVREIGIRTALGASRATIVGMVAREGSRMAGIGAACGLAIAIAAMRTVSSTVMSLPPIDGVTALAVVALCGAAVAAGCFVPARRAIRVDPVVALRVD